MLCTICTLCDIWNETKLHIFQQRNKFRIVNSELRRDKKKPIRTHKQSEWTTNGAEWQISAVIFVCCGNVYINAERDHRAIILWVYDLMQPFFMN